MGLLKTFFNNTGKPQGFLGKMMVNGMNSGHAEVSDWGMGFLEIEVPNEVVELGCGGGRNAAQLMKKYEKAKLTALDMTIYTAKQLCDHLRDAGFAETTIHRNEKKHWLCILARK